MLLFGTVDGIAFTILFAAVIAEDGISLEKPPNGFGRVLWISLLSLAFFKWK